MREVRASAPGKVNLTLRVGHPTEDGYHPLVTVFEALNMRETVTVRTSRRLGIHVTTTAYLPNGRVDEATTAAMADLDPENHLCVKAARSLQKLAAMGPWGHTAAGIEIHVEKHVPMAGGMAGGSADAAATLVACNALWELGLNSDQLEMMGRALGADVPACLTGGIALGTGRGDRMSLFADGSDEPRHHWAIALAHGGLSTPAVFRQLDQMGGPAGKWELLEDLSDEAGALLTGSAEQAAPCLVNDLTEAALELRPELAKTIAGARHAGALAVVLSGSGPTIAALATSAEDAQRIADELAQLPTVSAAPTTWGAARGAMIEHEDNA